MPTRNVNLTQELDSFVLARVESGRFENASEVVRAALRTLGSEYTVSDAVAVHHTAPNCMRSTSRHGRHDPSHLIRPPRFSRSPKQFCAQQVPVRFHLNFPALGLDAPRWR